VLAQRREEALERLPRTGEVMVTGDRRLTAARWARVQFEGRSSAVARVDALGSLKAARRMSAATN